MGVELVDDRERRGEPVQLGGVGGEDAQVSGDDVRFERVVDPAELEVADDDVRVLELAGEHGGGLVEDACLLTARGGAVDGRLRHGDQVVQRDRRHQGGLALAAGEEDDELAFGACGGACDPFLERLQVESDLLAEQGELHLMLLRAP